MNILPPSSGWTLITCFVKGKGKFTLEQDTKAQRRSRGIAFSFFNLGGRWGWVVNATPRPFYTQERHGTHCIGGWVGPKAGLDG
jgi:hypothetical protein